MSAVNAFPHSEVAKITNRFLNEQGILVSPLVRKNLVTTFSVLINGELLQICPQLPEEDQPTKRRCVSLAPASRNTDIAVSVFQRHAKHMVPLLKRDPTPIGVVTPKSVECALLQQSRYSRKSREAATPFLCTLLLNTENCEEAHLEKAYGKTLENMSTEEIGKVCMFLYKKCRTKHCEKAGLLFIWILKRQSGYSMKLPPLESFKATEVESFIKALLEAISDREEITKASTDLFDLLQHLQYQLRKTERVDIFKSAVYTPTLISTVSRLFKDATMAEWPGKVSFLRTCLMHATQEDRELLISALYESMDEASVALAHSIDLVRYQSSQ